ncbi:MAG TPA: alpha/beta fold hydrolase [Nakamurella sp.]|nr:alpha/beta fold hydrolase [Nakamurella sp.]
MPSHPSGPHRRTTVDTERHTVHSADGTRLSVLVARPPGGPDRVADAAGLLPPVLAVHGFASSAERNWLRTGHLAELTRAGRTVIAPDLRGHGLSDRPHGPDAYTLDGMLADLIAAVTGIAVEDAAAVTGVARVAGVPVVDLLGYSLGARLCWTLAIRKALPIRRMVLGGFDARPLFQGVEQGRLESLATAAPGNDLVALRALVGGLSGSGGTPTGRPLPAVPTLIVAGTDDGLATGGRELADRLPHGAFLAVPGRDHVSTVPASPFRRGVVEFLAG